MKQLNKYQAFVDMVRKNEDWSSDDKIVVNTIIVEAQDPEEARDKAYDIAREEYEDFVEFYVWEITDEDIQED